MRVTERFRDERGATAVIVALLMVVLIGMLALTVDGGLLWTKFRQIRTANDAAALAAAYSCANGEGLSGAEATAVNIATANVVDATTTQPGSYPRGCVVEGGEVTVHFGAEQSLMFGPAIGVSSPKPVAAQATAIWGGAGGASNVAPLMLSLGRLSDCNFPDGVQEGADCFFWWDNGTQNDTTALTNAEWGLVDLSTWGVAPWGPCGGNVSQSDVGTWIEDGYPGSLLIDGYPGSVPPPVEYVCRGNGFQGSALNNDVNAQAGEKLFFPVNDPQRQVQSDGTPCRPNGVDGPCSVQKYAMVGFAILEVVEVWTGQNAQNKCGQISTNNGSLRCLQVKWRGFQPGGLSPNPGVPNLGLFAVALTG
jgi:Flp pilus assembly pilin Flp